MFLSLLCWILNTIIEVFRKMSFYWSQWSSYLRRASVWVWWHRLNWRWWIWFLHIVIEIELYFFNVSNCCLRLVDIHHSDQPFLLLLLICRDWYLRKACKGIRFWLYRQRFDSLTRRNISFFQKTWNSPREIWWLIRNAIWCTQFVN